MNIAPLPLRSGRFGLRAFDDAGERQIFQAVRDHGMSPLQVAARVGVSQVTIYEILKRVERRNAEKAQP